MNVGQVVKITAIPQNSSGATVVADISYSSSNPTQISVSPEWLPLCRRLGRQLHHLHSFARKHRRRTGHYHRYLRRCHRHRTSLQPLTGRPDFCESAYRLCKCWRHAHLFRDCLQHDCAWLFGGYSLRCHFHRRPHHLLQHRLHRHVPKHHHGCSHRQRAGLDIDLRQCLWSEQCPAIRACLPCRFDSGARRQQFEHNV